jgi:OOP family OmpA-OmpF porin
MEPAAVAKPKEEALIDDVFLLYNDGLLIKHETRRLKPDVDSDILSGMLTAVQAFVKDSFRSDDGDELNEMTFGQMHILLARGKWLILAAIIGGDGVDAFTKQIKQCIEDMETHHWDQLESWNGDMVIAKTFGPYVKKLIRGDYTTAP